MAVAFSMDSGGARPIKFIFFMQRITILNSKLLAPRILHVLDRKRLYRALKTIAEKRLTMVTAGAGFGKTTAVAQAVEKIGLKTVWYSLDRLDIDFSTFMSYLCRGFQKHFPGACNISFDFIAGSAGAEKSRQVLLIRFLSDLENHIDEDMIVVLDDFQMVQDSVEINRCVQFVLERLPLSVHMVVIGRVVPDLPVSRLRVMGQVCDIGEADLAFTESEIEQLFSEQFHITVNQRIVRDLHRKTVGWATGLTLFYWALRGKETEQIETSLYRFKGSQSFVFQYLEENIFEMQSPEVKDFMLKTSFFSRMAPDTCDRLLGKENSAELLLFLEENHLFTFPSDEGRSSYCYHHLLRDFLQARARREFTGREIKKIQTDIAESMEKNGDRYGALEHYLEGQEYAEAARLLESLEIELIVEGRFGFIRECLKKMPDAFIERNPHILFLKAKLHSYSGRPRLAIGGLKAALRLYRKEHSKKNIAKCMADLGFHYYYTGDIRKADDLLKGILKEQEKETIISVEILTFLILFASILGDIDEADRYYRMGEKTTAGLSERERLLSQASMDLAYSYRQYTVGDFEKSQNLNFRILDLVKSRNADMFLPLTYFHISFTCYFLGQTEQGGEFAKQGLFFAEKIGVYDSQAAWLHYAMALNCLGSGKLADATRIGDESLKIFEAQGNRWGMASAYDLLHQACLQSCCHTDEARAYILSGLQAISGRDLPVTEAILETGLAGILILEEQYAMALSILKKACKTLKVSKYQTFRIYLFMARCHGKTGNHSEAMKMLSESLCIAKAKSYEHFLSHEKHWIVPLLVRLYSENRMRDYLSEVFGSPDSPFKEALLLLQKDKDAIIAETAATIAKQMPKAPPAPLRVCLLGKFAVYREKERIPSRAWKNSKALTIFKYLASNADQGFIHKEILLELLWPEEDSTKTVKRLNVALSALRKILEPELKRSVPSSYLIRQNDSYRLTFANSGGTDVQRFERKLALARENEKSGDWVSLGLFLEAETCFGGLFLEEDPYDDWCMEIRERLNSKYLYALEKIVDFYENEKNYEECIQYAEKYLRIDKYSERMYAKLMLFHFMAQNMSGVIKTFEKCKSHIMETLQCPLSEKTIQLYDRLISGKN